jgi:hypothetical protein
MAENDAPSSSDNRLTWERSYLALLAVSVVLLPPMTLLGYYAVRSVVLWTSRYPGTLPAITRYYLALGPSCVVVMGLAAALLVCCMWPLRRSIVSVVVSGISLVTCVLFMAVGQLGAYICLLLIRETI